MKLINLYESLLKEFQEDLDKKAVVLMGLPAAGKSTFINKEISKYIPDFKDYKVSNSDNQVKALQYQTAKSHYESLIRNKNIQKTDIIKFVNKHTYVNNRKKTVIHPLTIEWWDNNKDKGVKFFWEEFYKPYYATYFDIRDLAKEIDKQLFNTKVVKAGNILVIDTVAAKPESLFKRLSKLKENGYTVIIIYLETKPELCIIRDKYRESTEGRGVGEDVIFGYAKLMDNAFETYKSEGEKENGIIDRILHFNWSQLGDNPIKGDWIKVDDIRYGVQRKIKNLKQK